MPGVEPTREVIVINSTIDSVGHNINPGATDRWFSIKGFSAKIFDNYHQFRMFDHVRITIEKEPSIAIPSIAPLK